MKPLYAALHPQRFCTISQTCVLCPRCSLLSACLFCLLRLLFLLTLCSLFCGRSGEQEASLSLSVAFLFVSLASFFLHEPRPRWGLPSTVTILSLCQPIESQWESILGPKTANEATWLLELGGLQGHQVGLQRHHSGVPVLLSCAMCIRSDGLLFSAAWCSYQSDLSVIRPSSSLV